MTQDADCVRVYRDTDDGTVAVVELDGLPILFIQAPTGGTCPNGHPYTADSIYISRAGVRRCQVCRRHAVRRHRAAGRSDGADS